MRSSYARPPKPVVLGEVAETLSEVAETLGEVAETDAARFRAAEFDVGDFVRRH
jgi:hypothetical protein